MRGSPDNLILKGRREPDKIITVALTLTPAKRKNPQER